MLSKFVDILYISTYTFIPKLLPLFYSYLFGRGLHQVGIFPRSTPQMTIHHFSRVLFSGATILQVLAISLVISGEPDYFHLFVLPQVGVVVGVEIVMVVVVVGVEPVNLFLVFVVVI